MSDAYHGLYRDRLARGAWRDAPRPVLINNWEATYFDFDETKLVEIATSARDLGVELFVLDDGWFGERDDDTTRRSATGSSTGASCPNGLEGLAPRVEALGLSFGLWIEPEMVSERSELFAAHPDWAVGVPGRPRTESRQQLVLDMSRPEVVDHLVDVLSEVLASAPISYVKWDMNRNITEPYSAALPADRQGEFFHRYILGVYDLYAAADRRPSRRSCSSRAPAAAAGSTRACSRSRRRPGRATTPTPSSACAIQWGTSLVYPLSSMGAHVSAVPNHQVGRITPIATRAAVAFFGVFGYELDPTALCADERAGSPTRSRSTRPTASSSSAAGSSGCAARSRATATRPPGWPSRPTRAGGRRPTTGCSTGPVPPADRLRLRGLDPARSLPRSAPGRRATSRSSAPTPGSAAATS